MLDGVTMRQTTPFEMLVQLRMLDIGIVPPRSGAIKFLDEIRIHMATLSPEERRKSARKFRKLWRKAANQSLAQAKNTKGPNRTFQARRQKTLTRLETRLAGLYNGWKGRPRGRQQLKRSMMVFEVVSRQVRSELSQVRAKKSAD